MQTKTCTTCGEEKALTEFHKQRGGKYGVAGRCKECKREYLREYRHRPEIRERNSERLRAARGMGIYCTSLLEITAKYATRSGTPWSDAEVKFLMTSGLPLVDIALELGRSYKSVQMKLDKMRKLQDVA